VNSNSKNPVAGGDRALNSICLAAERSEHTCAAVGVPVQFLSPPAWKRAIGLPAGRNGAKDAGRSEAVRGWQAKVALFARVKDNGRAEAALIAVAGLRSEARGDG